MRNQFKCATVVQIGRCVCVSRDVRPITGCVDAPPPPRCIDASMLYRSWYFVLNMETQAFVCVAPSPRHTRTHARFLFACPRGSREHRHRVCLCFLYFASVCLLVRSRLASTKHVLYGVLYDGPGTEATPCAEVLLWRQLICDTFRARARAPALAHWRMPAGPGQSRMIVENKGSHANGHAYVHKVAVTHSRFVCVCERVQNPY